MARNGNPAEVARKVLKQVKDGKLPNIKDAMIATGYSIKSAEKNQQKIKAHPEYRRLIKPFIDEVDDLIAGAVEIIRKREGKATYRDGIEAMDKLKKLKALEMGTSTDNIAIKVGWESDKEA